MKAVLISIRPEWCKKIINGQKTIEVRKTRPKMDTPFKCYIYRSVQGGVIGEFVCDDIFERIVRVGAICEPPKYCICDWNMDCTPLAQTAKKGFLHVQTRYSGLSGCHAQTGR